MDQVPLELELHILPDIFQVNILTWSCFVKMLCITPKFSSQQIKMIKYGMCNEWDNVSKLSHFMFTWNFMLNTLLIVFLVKLKVFPESSIYITQGTIYVILANVIPTPHMWINVLLMGGKVLFNSRWWITFKYMIYNYVWCKMYWK